MHEVIITADPHSFENIKRELYALGAKDIKVMSSIECVIANVPEYQIANIIDIPGVFSVEKSESVRYLS